MLIGQHNHTLDDKNRLSLPSKFRKEFGKTVVITRGLDTCLFVYPAGEWKTFTDTLRALSVGSAEARSFSRFMLGSAVETDIDANGRILVPEYLKNFAKLQTKVIVAGLTNRVEIWNEESWGAYTSRVENEADRLAQHLGDIGMV